MCHQKRGWRSEVKEKRQQSYVTLQKPVGQLPSRLFDNLVDSLQLFLSFGHVVLGVLQSARMCKRFILQQNYIRLEKKRLSSTPTL